MDRSCVVVLFASLYIGIINASMCEPKSLFKLDCNECECSKSGLEYTCTENICPPSAYNKNYNIAQTKEGYIVLKPKPIDQYIFDDNNDFVISNKNVRKPRDGPNQMFGADLQYSNDETNDGEYGEAKKDGEDNVDYDYKENDSNNNNKKNDDIYKDVDDKPNKIKYDYIEIDRNAVI